MGKEEEYVGCVEGGRGMGGGGGSVEGGDFSVAGGGGGCLQPTGLCFWCDTPT
jgi:hypothetical protein